MNQYKSIPILHDGSVSTGFKLHGLTYPGSNATYMSAVATSWGFGRRDGVAAASENRRRADAGGVNVDRG